MSTSTVTKIRYGNTNTFLIRGSKGSILIDTDYAGTLPAFYKAIKELGIKVSDVNYVLATHYHPDHIGLVSELMDQGVKLLLMESQVNSVHYSDPIFAKEPHLNYKPIDEGKATILRFEDAYSFLESLMTGGLPAKCLPRVRARSRRAGITCSSVFLKRESLLRLLKRLHQDWIV